MSWKDCADSIRKAAGRDLTDEQVAELFEAVDRRKRAIEATGNLDRLEDRLRLQVEYDTGQLRIEAALAKKHAALSVIARDQATRTVERHIANGLTYRKAVLALFEGNPMGIEGSRASVAATKMAYESRYMGTLMGRLEREVPHGTRMLRDEAFLDDIVREMMQPGSSRNTDARKAAAIFSDVAEMSRQDLNRLGANIGKLEGWAGAQIHDADALARIGRDEWIGAILPKLDLARTFPDLGDEAAVRRALGNVWENIVYSPDRQAPQVRDGFQGPRNVARALEQHRVLHFKGADDWLSYSRDFGHGHIFDGMVGHLSKAALNASQMELLGPNPGATLKNLLDTLGRKIDRDDLIPPAEKEAEKATLTGDPQTAIGMAFRVASGANLIPISRTMADIGSSARAVASMAKLGGALISSAGDLVTSIVNLRFNGLSFHDAIGRQFGELMQGRGAGEQRQLAFLVGEGFDGMVGHIVSPYVANDGAPGAMQRLMATFFRLNGLSWWTDANRAGVARILMANLGENAGKTFDALDGRMQNVLRQHGIEGATWDAIRANTQTIDGRAYVTPEGLGDLKAELALRRYIADEAASGILEADAASARFTTAGFSRGTVQGEAMRFLTQFKGYPIAFTQRVLGRAYQGGAGGASAGAAHVGSLIAGLTVMGYASMTAKDALKGYEPREFTDEQGDFRIKTITAALLQSGGLGIYGDFLFAEASRSGNSLLENLAGPIIADAAKVGTLYQKARNGEAGAGEALSAVLGSTPFYSLPFVKAPLDYLILNELREAFSPGYFARQDARRRKDFGQDPLIAPSDRMAFDMF